MKRGGEGGDAYGPVESACTRVPRPPVPALRLRAGEAWRLGPGPGPVPTPATRRPEGRGGAGAASAVGAVMNPGLGCRVSSWNRSPASESME